MPDQLTGIEVFCRVAQLSSFSAASRELRMSAAMVSKHVQALEARLGVALIIRSTRHVELTAAGRAFLASCSDALHALREAEASVAGSLTDDLPGELRVHSSIFFAAEYVLPAVFRLRRSNPSVVVDLDASDRFVNPIREGFDLSFSVGGPLDGLDAIELCRTERIVAAAPAYLDQAGMPLTTEHLSAHECLTVLGAQRGPFAHWRFGPSEETIVRIRSSLRVSNEMAVLHAGLSGQGLMYLPRLFIQAAITSGRLVEIALAGVVCSPVRVTASRSLGQPMSRRAAALVALVEERILSHRPPYRPVPEPDTRHRAEDAVDSPEHAFPALARPTG